MDVETSPDIRSAFTQSQALDQSQAAEFWEQQAGASKPEEVSSPGTLSYEEARKLGLINDLDDQEPPA